MPKTFRDLRSLCRDFTDETVQIVAGIARAPGTPPGVRVAAIGMLWDRGWGKAPQAVTGENGEGAIRVVVRHILEADRPTEPRIVNGNKEIEHKPASVTILPTNDG